jgi:hypothetical protein
MIPKIRELNNNLRNVGWWVTEAYPPTSPHESACHNNGSCFDANLTGAANAADINAFLNAAQTAGFGVIYEVRTEADRQRWITAGVPAGNIYVNDHPNFTGSHFHVTL